MVYWNSPLLTFVTAKKKSYPSGFGISKQRRQNKKDKGKEEEEDKEYIALLMQLIEEDERIEQKVMQSRHPHNGLVFTSGA